MFSGFVPNVVSLRDSSFSTRAFSEMLPPENIVYCGAHVWNMPFCCAVHQKAEVKSVAVGVWVRGRDGPKSPYIGVRPVGDRRMVVDVLLTGSRVDELSKELRDW